MNKQKSWILAAAAAGVLAIAAPASATEVFDPIDQSTLDTFHTENFGVITDQLGDFTHTFNFITSKGGNASSSIVTISLASGAQDIDFSAIDLDGAAFEQHVFDPNAETWDLNNLFLSAGNHTITVHGSVVSGPSASYAGTLNISQVPEPATWAMMILGFGGLGSMIRVRRRRAAALA